MRRICTITTSLVLLAGTAAVAQDNPLPEGFETQPLIKSSVSRDDDPIAYPSGTPELVSVIGTLAVDGRTALHEHPVPVYVYVMEGEIELRTEGKEPHRYKAGEAYIETQNRKHQVFNMSDAPSKILAVFIGEQGAPTTVAAE